jgi:formate/nitrite transporter FocA (FNT family)
MNLFTGKAGLLATNEIEFDDLIRIWIGNFIGCFIVALCLYVTPLGAVLYESAQTIVALRIANGPIANLMYGIFCGMMMYIAVTGYSKSQNVIFVFVPVAVFILSGFNHCVADMFYVLMGANTIEGFGTLIPSTIGNVIGACSLSSSLQWANHHQ